MPLIISSLSFFEMPFSTAHHSSRNRISRHCTVYPFGVCHEPILASETHDHYLTLRRSSPRPFIDALHTGLLSLSVHRHDKPSTTLATYLTANAQPGLKIQPSSNTTNPLPPPNLSQDARSQLGNQLRPIGRGYVEDARTLLTTV